jgi:hypothetical protein
MDDQRINDTTVLEVLAEPVHDFPAKDEALLASLTRRPDGQTTPDE